MTNFYTRAERGMWPSYILVMISFIQVIVFRVVLGTVDWLGFSLGLGVFAGVFLSLEALARRVLDKESVRGGVISGFFWFVFKFFWPLGLFYYSYVRQLPFFFVFVGLMSGLSTVSLILWLFSRVQAENY